MIDFSVLDNYYFEISDIFVVKQISYKKTSTDMSKHPRSTDALMIFEKGTAICYQEGCKPLFVPQGAVVYMPKNSRYIWESSLSEEDGIQERILFEFTLQNRKISADETEKHAISPVPSKEEIHFSNKVKIISTKHSKGYDKLFNDLLNQFKNNSSPLSLYRNAYELLGILAQNSKYSKPDNKEVTMISKGVEYIENLENNKPNIKTAAKLCNMSVCHFERIFKKTFGTSPIDYINSLKIYKIKLLLQENAFTLSRIADMFGFCDSGYLCRFFKKQTGFTPKEYKKLYNVNFSVDS